MEVPSLGKTVHGFFKLNKGRAGDKVLKKRIVEGSVIDAIHLCQLIAAMIIASIGLNVDSTEAVIGAMLICPIMGSCLAVSYGITTLNKKLTKSSLISLVIQVLVCLATSTIYFVISPLSHATSELLTNSSATVWDVLIAFVGGFAGALGISRKQEPTTLLAGVAVATALMPPLCSTGYGFSMRDLVVASSAFYEFLINVWFITFGAEIVFVFLKLPMVSDFNGDGIVTAEERAEAEKRSRRIRMRLVVFSILLAFPSLYFSHQLIQKSMNQNGTVFEVVDTYNTENTTRILEILYEEFKGYRIGQTESYNTKDGKLIENVVATVTLSKDIGDDRKEQIKKLIELNVDNIDQVVFEVSDK